jgi:hypothetical protein
LKFLGYFGTVVEKLWQKFQPCAMMLKGDIHQTRVKNSFFGDPNFSVPAGAISLIFVLFERAYQHPEHDEALFFKILLFM